MEIKFLLSGLDKQFFTGYSVTDDPLLLSGFNAWGALDQLRCLERKANQTNKVKMHIQDVPGRDWVDYNGAISAGASVTSKISQRRGYAVATFTIKPRGHVDLGV